ncbi:MAG: type II CRISPR RNA-guided endonuclease Cas9 [Prevotellaceae bacterium]|nr:type II CRISPR RNA-guided endonuclease Cas9 [Prevotellaceae bacterium]
MKRIIGLDLGTSSIGWAVVDEVENNDERSSIVRLGVRVNPLTTDESDSFEKGKSIETNAVRRMKRCARRNLQRYKLRREELIKVLKKHHFISDASVLSENGNRTTFETYRLRAKAAVEKVELEELARVFLMINKKRGYKSSRKAKGNEDGKLIDGMEVAKKLYEENLTPGMLCRQLLEEKKKLPDFYRSDLQNELNRIWTFQSQFYPNSLTELAKDEIPGKNRTQTWAILSKYFIWKEICEEWNEEKACLEVVEKECKLKGLKRQTKGVEQKRENYEWREKALSERMKPEELAVVIQEINGDINASSGYLGKISDRSKSLFFNQLTVGQALMQGLEKNPNNSLKNMVYYRQDYLDEFEKIWETQAKYHKELTLELKHEIRDMIIFYQRRLKSQKSLIGICEFEREERCVTKDGKTKTVIIGSRVIPRSSPLFQEFKIWQIINNIEVSLTDRKNIKRKKSCEQPLLFDEADGVDKLTVCGKRFLDLEEKELLAKELSVHESMTKKKVLELLFDNPSDLDLNFKVIDGNKTGYQLYKVFSDVMELSGHEPLDFTCSADEIKSQTREVFASLGWNIGVLGFDSSSPLPLDKQDYYRLWHLLYSFESDNTPTGEGKLIEKVADLCGMEKEYAAIFSSVSFVDGYGSLSAKAIKKILPFMKKGNGYDVACSDAGYRHSASSLTKEEIENKELKDCLEILPKNSLRNPVVEKILNQMVNVVNEIIATYGRPDEIRVELARELKKNQKERKELTEAISKATKEQDEIRKLLQKNFGIAYPTRNDIVRYRLYEELKDNGYKTLYSDSYIPREKLFSKDFDIEHIIPKARLFDDSFSNKTLEKRDVNIEKGDKTAYDFVREKYGEEGLERYLKACEKLFTDKKAKLRKLKMREEEIPDGFIERDLRNTQYIAKRALSMLGSICRRVVATTGTVTDRLRNDWQLVDMMKELNWEKYHVLGLVEYHQDADGRQVGRIKEWTKRNDHRHHAMDALTVAFTKDVFVNYFNNKNASENPNSNEYAIKNKYFSKGRAIAPIPLGEFRTEAKRHLENILVSVKAKNKVVTKNVNKVKGAKDKVQQTPRGELHKETIYGSRKEYVTKEEKVGAKFNEEMIMRVCRPIYREALLWRLHQYNGDPKKAFTGMNSLEKNPIWLDEQKTRHVPEKVNTVVFKTKYTVRKKIEPDLKIEKVVDAGVRRVLEKRIEEYGGDAKKAFVNLDENPIWLNKAKGIALKRVTVYGMINEALPLHKKKDKEGNLILDAEENHIPCDFVQTGNNHHVAIYRKPVLDKQGNQVYNEDGSPAYELDEDVVSFYKAVARVNKGQPVVDKEYKRNEGWNFLFTMKQNEYFVFPNEETGFDPKEVDLMNPDNYASISPNLFRVQKIASRYYMFRHHLETTVEEKKELQNITWKRIRSLVKIDKIVKVRVNHIGQIVSVGEY